MKLKINIEQIENVMKLILSSFIHKQNMKLQLNMHEILSLQIDGKTIHIGDNLILSLTRWRHGR